MSKLSYHRGSVVAEFAVTLLLLVTLFIGFIRVDQIIYDRMVVAEGARLLARSLATTDLNGQLCEDTELPMICYEAWLAGLSRSLIERYSSDVGYPPSDFNFGFALVPNRSDAIQAFVSYKRPDSSGTRICERSFFRFQAGPLRSFNSSDTVDEDFLDAGEDEILRTYYSDPTDKGCLVLE